MMNVFERCLLIITLVGLCTPGFAVDYDIYNNRTIENGESLSGGIIYIKQTLTLVNHGSITGNLDVCNGCGVYIENTGIFDAPVHLGSSATLTQVIKNSNDITVLENIGVGYGVLIDGMTDVLNWNDIVTNTVGATKYTLENVQLYIDGTVVANNVDFKGRAIVYTNVAPNTDTLLFTNVSGTGTVNFVSSGLDGLYLIDQYMVGGDMYIRATRSTDYARVLNNETGSFLNELRRVSPDDPLLNQLDTAATFDEFNSIMNRSIKIHPIKMMQSLKTLYSHKMAETMHIARNDGIGVVPITTFSRDISSVGIEPFVNVSLFDDLHMKISGNVSNIKYSNDINSYTAMSYGIAADMIYELSLNDFVRLYGGANLSSFDAGLVFDGNGATENPNGWSGYAVGEFGHKFDIENKYYVSPFVMLGGDWTTILNSCESNYYAGVGSDIGFSFEFDGFQYGYSARGILRTDGGVGGELNANIWSLADDAGAGLRGGVFYDDEIGMSYHIALDAKFNF